MISIPVHTLMSSSQFCIKCLQLNYHFPNEIDELDTSIEVKSYQRDKKQQQMNIRVHVFLRDINVLYKINNVKLNYLCSSPTYDVFLLF